MTNTSRTLALLSRASKSFPTAGGERAIFSKLTLSMVKGECLSLLGPNGAGKSTLLHTIMGLERLTSGAASFSPSDSDLLGAVLQDYRSQLLPFATVRENLLIAAGGSRSQGGRSEAELLSVACSMFNRFDYPVRLDAKAGSLSGGEQQVVVLVRGALFRPDFWILDEPVSAVDLRRKERVYSFFDEHLACGRSILFVTHSLDEALRLADRIVVFDGGMNIADDFLIVRSGAERRDFIGSPLWLERRRDLLKRLLGLPEATEKQ